MSWAIKTNKLVAIAVDYQDDTRVFMEFLQFFCPWTTRSFHGKVTFRTSSDLKLLQRTQVFYVKHDSIDLLLCVHLCGDELDSASHQPRIAVYWESLISSTRHRWWTFRLLYSYDIYHSFLSLWFSFGVCWLCSRSCCSSSFALRYRSCKSRLCIMRPIVTTACAPNKTFQCKGRRFTKFTNFSGIKAVVVEATVFS